MHFGLCLNSSPCSTALPFSIWQMSTDSSWSHTAPQNIPVGLTSLNFLQLMAVTKLTKIHWSFSFFFFSVNRHTVISIYSKSQSLSIYILLHFFLLTSSHAPPLFFSSLFLLLLPLHLYKIPITLPCFSRSQATAWPLGSNMFREFLSLLSLCSNMLSFYVQQ